MCVCVSVHTLFYCCKQTLCEVRLWFVSPEKITSYPVMSTSACFYGNVIHDHQAAGQRRLQLRVQQGTDGRHLRHPTINIKPPCDRGAFWEGSQHLPECETLRDERTMMADKCQVTWHSQVPSQPCVRGTGIWMWRQDIQKAVNTI